MSTLELIVWIGAVFVVGFIIWGAAQLPDLDDREEIGPEGRERLP